MAARREAEPFTLLSPIRGEITPEFTHGQIGRLPSIENRFHNFRRKEDALQDSPDIALVKTTSSCYRPSIVEAAIDHALTPVMSARNRFQQRRCWLPDDFAVALGRHDQFNLAATAFQLCLSFQHEEVIAGNLTRTCRAIPT